MLVWAKRPNWLLWGFILVSLSIHGVIFFHITGLYRSHPLTRIELTLKNSSELPQRSIPRPRHRPVPPELPREVRKLVVKTVPIPIKVEPSENHLPDRLLEAISQSEIPEVQGFSVSNWEPEELTEDYETENSYFEMIRLRIEGFKKYPHLARVRQLEGMATLRFTITMEGNLKGLELVKSTRYEVLDNAALKAVRDAAPFPLPPKRISRDELTLEIVIVFELT